jgi:hypothetical protein
VKGLHPFTAHGQHAIPKGSLLEGAVAVGD